MLVDIHTHFDRAVPVTRLATYAGVVGCDTLLVANRAAASHGDDAPDMDEATANLACLDACRGDARLTPVYWARPGRSDSNLHALRGALALEPFVAVVLAPGANDLCCEDETLGPYLDVLAEARRPALMLIDGSPRSDPAGVARLARRHPALPIVLCGCGAPPARRGEILDVVRWSRERNDANLYLDTAHMTAQGICDAAEAAGADRLLFGSDALAYEDAHIPRHIALLDELRHRLRTPDFRRITGENAAQLFELHLPVLR